MKLRLIIENEFSFGNDIKFWITPKGIIKPFVIDKFHDAYIKFINKSLNKELAISNGYVRGGYRDWMLFFEYNKLTKSTKESIINIIENTSFKTCAIDCHSTDRNILSQTVEEAIEFINNN